MGTGKKEARNFRLPLIGEQSPSFTAESTTGTVNFPDDYGRSWKILFSHPQDFTPVKIKFPLVDDENLVVQKQYGMIHSASNTTKDVRGVFIIDPDNTIQAIYFYPCHCWQEHRGTAQNSNGSSDCCKGQGYDTC